MIYSYAYNQKNSYMNLFSLWGHRLHHTIEQVQGRTTNTTISLRIIIAMTCMALLTLLSVGSIPSVYAASSTGGSLPGAFSLSASGATNAVNLSWGASSGATSYNVYNGSSGATIASGLSSSQTSYSVTSLSCGTSYSYFVKALNAYGGTNSSTVSATTAACPVPPAAPTNVGASNNGAGIKITWVDPGTISNITGYYVYRSGSYIGSATPNNASVYTDTPGATGLAYTYSVASYGPTGTSGQVSSNTVYAQPPTPSTPTVSAASQSSINISWTAVTGATNYYIYRNGSYVTVTSRTAYSDTYLPCGTSYTYTLVAVNSGGSSGTSGGASATTDQCTPGTPSAISGYATNQTTATISWTRNSPLTDTNVYIQTSPNAGTLIVAGGSTSATMTTLACGTSYTFTVSPYVYTNGRYYYATGGTSNSITTGACTPGTPSNVTAAGITAQVTGQTTATVSWTRNSPYTDSGFYVYTSTGTYVGWGGPGVTSVNVGGLSCGTSYQFYVKAYVNTTGGTYWSANSGLSNAITTLPCSPQNFTVSQTGASASSITLTWTAASGATSYVVYRNTAGVTGTSATSYTDTGLSCGSSYSYYITASNAGGSTNSNTITGITLPCGVSLSASAINQNQINVSWTNTSGNASSFNLREVTQNATINSVLSPYSDAGLVAGTQYCFILYAVNAWGSTASSQVCATTYPPAVTGLTGSPTSQSSISLSWNAASGATGYHVYTAGTTTDVSGSPTSNAYISIGSLAAGTTYSYVVVPYNTGTGPTSGTVYVTTDACTPSAPTVSVSASGGIETVSWTPQGCSATGFNVSTSPATYGQQTSGTSVTYNLSGTYAYCVNAYVTTNGRTYTSANACTASITVPGQPGTPTVTPASQTTMSLSWSAASYASGYYIFRNGVNVGSTTGTSYTDSGLSAQTTYSYAIQAYNGSSTGAMSGSASGTTDPCTPGTPTIGTATVTSGNSASVTWTPTGCSATGFNVYAYDQTTASLFSTTGAGSSPGSITGLTAGHTYYFYVQAYVTGNGRTYYSGNSGNSNSVIMTPGSLTLSGSINGSNTVSLSWPAVTGASSYGIYRATAGSSGPWTQQTTVTTTSYSQSVSCGSGSYWYYVTAINSSGSSAPSNTISVTAVVCAPGTPATPSVTASNQSQIAISWTAVSGATGYHVYRGGTEISGSPLTGTSITDSSLACGTSYTYTVSAYNAGGTSTQSTGASATTDQCTPGVITIGSATPTGQTTASVTYTPTAPLTANYLNIYANGASWKTNVGTGSPVSITGLSANTNYYFSVIACVSTNGRNYCGGTSSNSNTITTDQVNPGTPSAVGGTATSQNNATITWKSGSPAPQSGFYITTTPATITTTVTPGSATSGGISNLTCGTTYTASVQAYVTTNGRTYYSGTGTSGSFTTSACISAPSTASAGNLTIAQLAGWPEVNVAITQANSSVSGYAVVLNGLTIDTGTSNVTAATSLPNFSSLTCPKNYTANVYAYTIDTSLNGATSATCSGVNLPSPGNKKCSPATTITVPVNYCTQGFFQN